MSHATAVVRLPRDADVIWRAVGGFGAIGHWHPLIARAASDGEQAGACRRAETVTGQTQVERLQEMRPQQRFYRYRIEQTPMPVRNCVAELRVSDNGDGTSTVEWSSEFEVAEGDEAGAVKGIRDFCEAGLRHLKELCD